MLLNLFHKSTIMLSGLKLQWYRFYYIAVVQDIVVFFPSSSVSY